MRSCGEADGERIRAGKLPRNRADTTSSWSVLRPAASRRCAPSSRNCPPTSTRRVFVVLHLPPSGTSVLPRILSRAGSLRAVHASDGVRFERGCIYIAPPDQHMRFSDGHVTLDRGPTENGHRPAVDPMFRSAAETFGGRVIGVVLSGVLDDGAAGLSRSRSRRRDARPERRGRDVPDDAAAALEAVGESDVVGNASELAAAIVALTRRPPDGPTLAVSPAMQMPRRVPRGRPVVERATARGQPERLHVSRVPRWTLGDAGRTRQRFQCRTGHAFSPESLVRAARARRARVVGGVARARGEGGDAAADVAAREGPGHRHRPCGSTARRMRFSVKPSRSAVSCGRSSRSQTRSRRGGGVTTDRSAPATSTRCSTYVKDAARLRLHAATRNRASPAASRSGSRRARVADYDEYRTLLEQDPDEFVDALRHDPHQRHVVLPRRVRVGLPARSEVVPQVARGTRRRAAPRLVDGLRDGRGGVHRSRWSSRRRSATTTSGAA